MHQIQASERARPCRSRVDNWNGRSSRLLLGLLAILAATTPAAAKLDYPMRAITVIVPFAAGGPTDIVARIVTAHMAKTFRQQIMIENVVGAGGTTAASRAMRAAPDGYTLLIGHMGTHGNAVAVYPQLAYDPVKDFAPIGLVIEMPSLVLARADLPAQNLGDLARYLNNHSKLTTMAHAGIGSVSYATCTLLNSIIDAHPATKAYQGTGPALQALMAGHVDYMCDQIVSAFPRIKSGDVKALAIVSPRRSPVLPDVPTATEAGIGNFAITAWNALFAPKGTPRELIDRLNAALGRALDDPDVRKELTDLGSEVPSVEERSPAELAKRVESEIARWTPSSKPPPVGGERVAQ